eukprot:8340426-Pyramimonas_sp.AAC.3
MRDIVGRRCQYFATSTCCWKFAPLSDFALGGGGCGSIRAGDRPNLARTADPIAALAKAPAALRAFSNGARSRSPNRAPCAAAVARRLPGQLRGPVPPSPRGCRRRQHRPGLVGRSCQLTGTLVSCTSRHVRCRALWSHGGAALGRVARRLARPVQSRAGVSGGVSCLRKGSL